MTQPVLLRAPLALDADESDALPRRFSGLAYSGDVVADRDLIIDLDTLRVSERPHLLADHDPQQVIGTVVESRVEQGLRVAGELFADIDPKAKDIAAKSRRGARYELSIGVFGGRFEHLTGDATATINGRTVRAPTLILRDGRVREVSVVPLGADPSTSVAFLAALSGRPSETPTMPDPTPTPDAAALAALESENAALKSELSSLKAKIAEIEQAEHAAAVAALLAALGKTQTPETQAVYANVPTAALKALTADAQALASARHADRLKSLTGDGALPPPGAPQPSRLVADMRRLQGLN